MDFTGRAFASTLVLVFLEDLSQGPSTPTGTISRGHFAQPPEISHKFAAATYQQICFWKFFDRGLLAAATYQQSRLWNYSHTKPCYARCHEDDNLEPGNFELRDRTLT